MNYNKSLLKANQIKLVYFISQWASYIGQNHWTLVIGENVPLLIKNLTYTALFAVGPSWWNCDGIKFKFLSPIEKMCSEFIHKMSG
jgi:hypothetical protein